MLQWINTIGVIQPTTSTTSINNKNTTQSTKQTLLIPHKRTSIDLTDSTTTTTTSTTSDLLYHCTYGDCSKSFDKKVNLRKHMKRHDERGEYHCLYNGCNSMLTSKNEVKITSMSFVVQ